jgi:hypothetical protein
MRQSFLWLVTIASAVAGFAGYWWTAPREESFGLFESGAAESTVKFGVTFVAVIAGVILGSLYRSLKYLADRGTVTIKNLRRFLSRSFRSVDMWLGLVASPVVYAVLLQTADGMELAGLVFTGLQNGFCCLVIANALIEKTPPKVDP